MAAKVKINPDGRYTYTVATSVLDDLIAFPIVVVLILMGSAGIVGSALLVSFYIFSGWAIVVVPVALIIIIFLQILKKGSAGYVLDGQPVNIMLSITDYIGSRRGISEPWLWFSKPISVPSTRIDDVVRAIHTLGFDESEYRVIINNEAEANRLGLGPLGTRVQIWVKDRDKKLQLRLVI